MNKRLNVSEWSDEKCSEVWHQLVTDVPYDWDLRSRKVATKNLLEILEFDQIELNKYLAADIDSAKELRNLIGHVLHGKDAEKAKLIAKWVVGSWGGISSGIESVPGWVVQLRPFTALRIQDFVNHMGNNRISSWSKITAFADFKNHAIYDSRTAVALNSALLLSNFRPRFYMPPSKSKKRNEVVKAIKSCSDDFPGGYEEYCFVLQRFVFLGLTSSILDAERAIFAGADLTGDKLLSFLRE